MKWRLVVLALVVACLAVVYLWWQRNAARLLDEQARLLAGRFVTNPEALAIESKPPVLRGWREARVPEMIISGEGLLLRDGPTLQKARIVLRDLDVAGPPFAISAVGGGQCSVVVTDAAVTEFVRRRGITVKGFSIPVSGLTVAFAPGKRISMKLALKSPVAATLSAAGDLVPAAAPGDVDFRPDPASLRLGGKPLPSFLGGLSVLPSRLNPIVSTRSLPVTLGEVTVATATGTATLSAKVTGVRPQGLVP